MDAENQRQEPGIGDNKGPPPTLEERLSENSVSIRAEVEALAKRADAAPKAIQDDADNEVIGKIVVDARKLWTRVDGLRTEEKEPYLEGGRVIDTFFSVPKDRLTNIGKTLSARGDVYTKAKAEAARLRARQEAEEARREEERRLALAAKAEEAGRAKNAVEHEIKAETAAETARAHEHIERSSAADLTRVRTSTGGLASAKEPWVFEIEDYAKIPFEELRPYLKREDVEKAIRAGVRASLRKLEGVRIYQDTRAAYK